MGCIAEANKEKPWRCNKLLLRRLVTFGDDHFYDFWRINRKRSLFLPFWWSSESKKPLKFDLNWHQVTPQLPQLPCKLRSRPRSAPSARKDYLFGDENKIVWIKVVDLSFFTSLERNKEQLSRIEDKSEKSSQPAFDNYEKYELKRRDTEKGRKWCQVQFCRS